MNKTPMNKSIHLNIGGDDYRIEIGNEGEYPRFDMYKAGRAKPHHLHYHPDRYHDSEIPNWGCSCQGWTNKKDGKPRYCKHLTALRHMIATLSFKGR